MPLCFELHIFDQLGKYADFNTNVLASSVLPYDINRFRLVVGIYTQ